MYIHPTCFYFILYIYFIFDVVVELYLVNVLYTKAAGKDRRQPHQGGGKTGDQPQDAAP